MLICITKMQKDIKATIEEMRAEKVITEEEYSYIVGKDGKPPHVRRPFSSC